MRRVFWSLILLVAVAGLYLLAPRIVTVVRGAGTITPSGLYGGASFQIYRIAGNTHYCESTGMGFFSGGPSDPVGTTGTATFSAFTLRCDGVVQASNATASTTYTITGTNEFIAAPPSGDPNGPLHGRTLANGDVVILDGTTRFPPAPFSGDVSLIDYGTFARPVAQQH